MPQQSRLRSSKCLTSNCCRVFVLISSTGTLWPSCVRNETNRKHFSSTAGSRRQSQWQHIRKEIGENKQKNREQRGGQNEESFSIIKLSEAFVCRGPLVADSSWFLSPFLQLETAVTSATCAAGTSRAGSRSQVTYICPRTEFTSYTRAQPRSGHHPALGPPDKRKCSARTGRRAARATAGLEAHAEPLQPHPLWATGNAQDLKSCETSSGMSQ